MALTPKKVAQLGTLFSTLGGISPDPNIRATSATLLDQNQQNVAAAEADEARRDAEKAAKRKTFRDLGAAFAGPLGGGVGQSLAGGSFDEGFSTSLGDTAGTLTSALKTGGLSGGATALPGALGGAAGAGAAAGINAPGTVGGAGTGTGGGFVPTVEASGTQGVGGGGFLGPIKSGLGGITGLLGEGGGTGDSLSGDVLNSTLNSSQPTVIILGADGNFRSVGGR